MTLRGQTLITKVSDLIDPTVGEWDEVLIQAIFNPVDARRILQISRNYEASENFIAWHHTRNDTFSVKTTYHAEWAHKFRGSPAGPGPSVSNPIWNKIWQLEAPRKVQIFCWRSLHGVVPVWSILANRHIPTPGECPVCHRGAEDIRHLLFICSLAVEIWRRLEIYNLIEDALLIDRSGSLILEYLLSSTPGSLPHAPDVVCRDAIATACWYIWWLRRQITNGERVPPAGKCAASIISITGKATRKIILLPDVEWRWTKPELRFVKLNVDAAYNANKGVGATATILCDIRGNFIVVMHILSYSCKRCYNRSHRNERWSGFC